jgi:hypothetical protein
MTGQLALLRYHPLPFIPVPNVKRPIATAKEEDVINHVLVFDLRRPLYDVPGSVL